MGEKGAEVLWYRIGNGFYLRDLDTSDSELRLLAAVRWSIREQGGEPSSRHVDELLDELL
jgi:hypothetical protein